VSMANTSILDIVRRCQADPDDRDAFDVFYRTFYPYVRLYTRAFRLPQAPLSDEDVVQDIFLKLMEHFPEVRFKNESHFLGYLKAVCEHYVIDMVRKYEKQTYEELTEELLVGLIGQIPGTCQNLLRAFLDEGLGLAEIANRQNVPLGTIYPRFSRCVAELRRRLDAAK
jgi:DNA-directed RNA polymerase specialized sigma24 family protein